MAFSLQLIYPTFKVWHFWNLYGAPFTLVGGNSNNSWFYEFWKLFSSGSAVIVLSLEDPLVWPHGVSLPLFTPTHANWYSAKNSRDPMQLSRALSLLLPSSASSVLSVPAVLAAPNFALRDLAGLCLGFPFWCLVCNLSQAESLGEGRSHLIVFPFLLSSLFPSASWAFCPVV